MSYTTPTPLLAYGAMTTPTPLLAFGHVRLPNGSLLYEGPPAEFQRRSLGAIDATSTTALWIIGGGVVVLGLGWLIYRHQKRMDTIAEREGSSGLLKYHAGTAAIGIGSQLASELISGGRRGRRNGSRRRLRRRGRR